MAKSKKKKSFLSRKPSFKNPRAIVFAVLALVGAYGVYRVFAASPQAFSDDAATVVVEVRHETPIQQQVGTATPQAIALRLYGDGTLVCNNNGTLAFKQLAQGENQSLLEKLYNTGITNTGRQVSNDKTSFVGDSTTVAFNLKSGLKDNSYYSGVKPQAYDRVDQVVNSACLGVVTPLPATFGLDPAPIVKTKEKADEPTGISGVFGRVGNWVVGKVMAFTMAPGLNDELAEVNNINAKRASVGRAALTRSRCLTKEARAWAQTMASQQTLYHSNVASNVSTNCNSSWTWAGENVGMTGGCNYQGYDNCEPGLFGAFVASPGHLANILDTDYNLVGVGAYRDSTGRLWVAQEFARACSTCGTVWRAAIPNVHSYSYPVNLPNKAIVKPGDVIYINAAYQSFSGAVLTNAYLNGMIPPYTTWYSGPNIGSNYYVTGSGHVLSSTPHDPTGMNEIWANMSSVQQPGGSYYSWGFQYGVRVNAGTPRGTQLCFHTDIRGDFQPTWHSSRTCYTVNY